MPKIKVDTGVSASSPAKGPAASAAKDAPVPASGTPAAKRQAAPKMVVDPSSPTVRAERAATQGKDTKRTASKTSKEVQGKASAATGKASKRSKAVPTRVVEEAAVDAARHEAAPSTSSTSATVPPAPVDGQAPADPATANPRLSVAAWVRRTFPGHENAFWGGVIALVVALLVFAFGLWRMLFIGLLVAVGVAVGQILDGDAKIIRTLRDLLDSDRDQD